jgi:hypothetical protein
MFRRGFLPQIFSRETRRRFLIDGCADGLDTRPAIFWTMFSCAQPVPFPRNSSAARPLIRRIARADPVQQEKARRQIARAKAES